MKLHQDQLYALLLAILISAIQGCANLPIGEFDEPEVELLGLEPIASQGLEARFLLRLRIVNPNDIALDVEGMAYEVFIRGSKVLTGVSNQALRVEPYSESIAELEVAAGMLDSLALIRDLLGNPPEGGLPYRLNAKISRKGILSTLRVSREGTIDLNKAVSGERMM
ncbi:MAG: hypothetical protein Cons2KO_00170 [Congregibacter sp.]